MRTYDEVRKDWETLWAYGPAYDMTGGYVDQEDLDKLLRKPTKVTARNCMLSQIHYWLDTGPDIDGLGERSTAQKARDEIIENDPAVREIAERYGYA